MNAAADQLPAPPPACTQEQLDATALAIVRGHGVYDACAVLGWPLRALREAVRRALDAERGAQE